MPQYEHKDKAYNHIIDELKGCTEEDTDTAAVVLIVDSKNESLRIYGLNMDEMELPLILIEAADKVRGDVVRRFVNRTIN